MSLIPDKVIIAVDFDGSMTTEQYMGSKLSLKPFCKEVILELSKNPIVELVLWTCRYKEPLEEALFFLETEGVLPCFDSVNEQAPSVQAHFKECGVKVGADYYIDDKNIFCTSVDWFEIASFFKEKGLLLQSREVV